MMIAPIDRRPFPLPVKPFEPAAHEVVDQATHAMLDGNGDGAVCKDEWKTAGWDADRFKLFDANNDGKVSQTEFTQARRLEREFVAKDRNADGVLSRPEFEGIRKFFGAHFGSVGKGLIDGAEKANDMMLRCIPPFIRDRFAAADKDGDGGVSKEEYFASRRELSLPIKLDPRWNLHDIKPTPLKAGEA